MATALPRPISESDDVASFDSGEPSLDDYLRTRALTNHAGKFRRNMPDPVPVILLSRLAVDRSHQGRGLGENLLRDAIARSVQVADQIGVRVMLVHAIHDQARRFYRRYQFEPSPTDPLQLLLLIKDAEASMVVRHTDE